MQMGMTPGAALAFFITGPATKFSTLSVFSAVLGRRSLGFYLTVMLLGAMLWGYVYPFPASICRYIRVVQPTSNWPDVNCKLMQTRKR